MDGVLLVFSLPGRQKRGLQLVYDDRPTAKQEWLNRSPELNQGLVDEANKWFYVEPHHNEGLLQ